jgi:hypothetical protein
MIHTPNPPAFRVQARQPSGHWWTFTELPTEAAAYEEAMVAREVAGLPTRVVRALPPMADGVPGEEPLGPYGEAPPDSPY